MRAVFFFSIWTLNLCEINAGKKPNLNRGKNMEVTKKINPKLAKTTFQLSFLKISRSFQSSYTPNIPQRYHCRFIHHKRLMYPLDFNLMHTYLFNVVHGIKAPYPNKSIIKQQQA